MAEISQARNLDGSIKLSKEHRRSFLRNYVLPRAVFLTFGLPKDSFGSIDLTYRCNLRCLHCYFYEEDHSSELSDLEWLQRFQELAASKRKIWSVTWVGGEPLLRRELIEIGKKNFVHNLIVTNGLIPLPNWKDVYFHVSVDGDEMAHEKQRNQKGIYSKIMNNADRPELDVSVAYCVSSLNEHCVEKVLQEWKGVGIKGFLFSFYTPMVSLEDPLFPGWEERDRILDRLIHLKKTTYPEFILNELRVLELMKSQNAKKVTDACLFAKKGFALDTLGKRKAKCMMGDKADCDRCGCIVPFHLHWRSERKKILADIVSDFRRSFA